VSIPPDHSAAQYAPPPDQVPRRHLGTQPHSPPDSLPWWRRTWVIAAGAFVVGAGIAGAAASVVATHTATARTLNDGRYLVGSGIQPGTYATDGNSDGGCGYSRLSNLSGDPSAIIARNLSIFGPTMIEVEPTDKALKLVGGCDWVKIGSSPLVRR
jgi:hypothetical protein